MDESNSFTDMFSSWIQCRRRPPQFIVFNLLAFSTLFRVYFRQFGYLIDTLFDTLIKRTRNKLKFGDENLSACQEKVNALQRTKKHFPFDCVLFD